MRDPESAPKNEMRKLLRDFQIQTTRSNDSQQQKKRNCYLMVSVDPADHRVKMKDSNNRDKYQRLARVLKKTMEHEGDCVYQLKKR